eukprot:TRINITY_DN3572_c0_g1_i14.p1 TRINITY_DN3572_c0_g1~~TRINITY_DN3572_c0_g1_i14.p1  ORF type:complete len:646 (-),score=152.69 TRINITY_DN3572_c0_g1_i14:61-1998(-)
MIRRPPRSTLSSSSAASDVYKRQMLPFPLMFQDTAATCMPAPEMDYHCNIKMWNGGNVDGWNTQRDPGFGMSFFNRTDLDFYYALADEFSVGDQYFQSTYTATNPNREFLFTGSNGLSVNNSGFCLLDDSEPAGLTWETMAETLIKKNISWKVYQGQDNFDDNGFAWFEQFKAAKPGDPLHDLGMIRQDDFVQSFAGDVANDTLPQVSWIVGPSSLSEHATNHPVDGMDLTARLLAALSANPAVYAKTVFILNYDEGGQFYDHVVPPSAPRSAEDGASTVSTVGELTLTTEFEIPVGNPIGPGWRVPLFLVSPWTRAPGGLVYSQVSDHTSVIKFIEKRFSVTCPNMSPWRRTTTGDLTAAFDWNNPDFTWPSLPSTKGDVNASKYQCMDNPPPVVPKIQSMPRQEPGVKQSRALPYEFQISDALSHDDVNQDYITITIANTGNATAVFHVYDRNLALSTPQKFTVEPSKQLQPRWRFTVLGKYALDLHGPNGFVRKFRGNGADSLSVRLEYQPEQRNVNLKLTGGAGCALNVQDLGYGGGPWTIAAGASEFPINVTATGNWYDLKVTSSCDGDFSRRFMGRMETGVTSITDPAMGSHVPADTEIHPSVPERLRHPVWDPVEQCKAPRMKMKDACWYVNHRKDEL